jgi:Glycosyl transferase family 11
MIIVKLSGGIGNQLFQYALGKNLSVKNNVALKFETSEYTSDARKYSLSKFTIPESILGISTETNLVEIGLPSMRDKSLWGRMGRKIFRITEYFKPIYERKFVLEPCFNFYPDILKIKDDCYLSGVWQSEKYFKDSENIIRKELTLKNKLSIEAAHWIEKIGRCNSVSLHIRRGDYVDNPKVNQLYAMEYYTVAIELISQKISNPVFFIFSDDMTWVKNNFEINRPSFYVSDKKIPDYEELIIMSTCKHSVIANSSFSWWGAWLNKNPSKMVLTPKEWFNTKNINTNDLIPSSWIKI